MFVIPLAIKFKAEVTVAEFIVKNLIPATLGNIIGGGLFVATFFGLAYGSWEKYAMSYVYRIWARSAPGALSSCAAAGCSQSSHLLHGHLPPAVVAEHLPVTTSMPPAV